jgi:hypothetical protein
MASTPLTSSFLRINDIELRVPPKNITILKQDHNASVSTLRSQSSTWVKSGRRTISIIIDTYFATGYDARTGNDIQAEAWINEQLAPLLIQARKCPFVSIENEKIRKEIIGKEIKRKQIETLVGTNATIDVSQTNMAAVIKQIDVESKAREPGMFNVRIHLEWFNYTPFSPDFAFKKVEENGVPIATSLPDNQFQKFIESGTLASVGETGAGPAAGTYTNGMSPGDSNDLELIYKEYKRIDEQRANAQTAIDALFNFDIDESEKIYVEEADAGYKEALREAEKEGWLPVDDFQASDAEVGTVLFRYRRYKIRDYDNPFVIMDSGRILVESARISLQTKTVSIPLIGHTVPTAQFLGASDGNVTFNLFANAELKDGLDDGEAVGTSSRLSKINSIIELVSRNAVNYRRVAKNDSIFIKHPMSKLLKYKRYDEQRLKVLDEQTGEIGTFDPNQYLGCMVQNTESQTVEGAPFCSRFSFSLTENHRAKDTNIKQANQGPSNRVYQSSLSLVQKLADKYGIAKNGKTFQIGINTQNSDPDFNAAVKLTESLNDALSAKDFSTVEAALSDVDFVERRLRDVKGDIRDNYPGRTVIWPNSDINGGDRITSMRPFSSDMINEVVWDLLKVTAGTEEKDQRFTTYQKDLTEFRGFNLTIDESNYPDMMLPDQTLQPDFFFYNKSDQGDNRYKRRILEKVQERYAKGGEQYAEEVSDKEASKKISDDMRGSPGPPQAAPNIITLGADEERPEKGDFDKGFTQAPISGPQQFLNTQAAVDNFSDITYTMRRSMPTFKLYIKEGDVGSLSDVDKDRLGRLAGSGIWRNFTDFYDISAIVDLRLVKDKHNPADVLVIRIANTREDLVNKAFEDNTSKLANQVPSTQRTKPKNGETKGRDKKVNNNQLDDVMFKEGTRIELRLGYEGDPNHLSVEFTGRVSQIGGGDVVEVVCQGDGIELIQELKGVGVATDFTYNSNTPNMISKLLHSSPEVQSFGTINAKNTTGDSSFFWGIAGGRTAVENIFAPSLFGNWDTFKGQVTKWAGRGQGVGSFFGVPASIVPVVGTAAGAAIGAAAGFFIGGTIGVIAGIKDVVFTFFKGSKFVIYEQTIWDVLQELTLRHPGTICDVVNFDRRSTIFFGYPEQLYFHRGPTYEEALIMGGDPDLSATLSPVERNLQDYTIAKTGRHNLTKIFSKKELFKNEKRLVDGKTPPKDIILPNGKVDRSNIDAAPINSPKPVNNGDIPATLMKQYRNYHMITAEHDIIENGMIVNSDGVFNSIQVVYPKDSDDQNSDGSVGFAEYKKTDEIKADDDLNKDFIKRQTLVFHNAHTDLEQLELPKTYAVSALCKSLNNVYQGKIKILGRGKIKPHDVVFVYDSYNGIYGPIEVENVVHIFSYGTGWITEITPNMIVVPSTSTQLVHLNAMQRLTHSFYLRNMKLLYTGAMFNNQTEVEDSSFNKTALNLISQTAAGAAGSATAVLAQRAVVDGLSELGGARGIGKTIGLAVKESKNRINTLRNVRSLKNTKGLFKGAKALGINTGIGLKFGASRLFGASVPLLLDLGLDYVIAAYISWSKYRQPIMFAPVTRNGKPWYTGLYGLNNNTEMDAIKEIGKDIIKEGDYFADYFRDQFPEVFD